MRGFRAATGVRHHIRTLLLLLVALPLQLTVAEDFPLDELQPGLTGFAVTAAAGNRLERFSVEVLALQEDVGMGFPLVLVRTEGDVIERSGGVAAGMSGSPVYLEREGRRALLGAIAFVFPNSDHRLALVTPIGAMRGVLDRREVDPFGEAILEALPAPIPVATPLLLSGVGARGIEALAPLFHESPLDLLPIQGGGTSTQEQDFNLQPGSAVSVQLVRGDVTIAAVGTVTTIENGELLAFGHPLLGQGRVSYALAPAFILHIVPSDVVPFKLANSGARILGSIVQDRSAAIAGEVTTPPELLPVTLTLSGERGSVIKRFELVRDERFYAPLLAAATLQAFDEVRDKIAAGTSEVAWEIGFETGDQLSVTEQITDPDDLATATARLAAEPLLILGRNAFEQADLERVSITIRYQDDRRVAEVVNVATETPTVDPGEAVVAFVRLQPFREEAQIEEVRVNLPEDLTGEVTLTFRAGEDRGDGEDEEDEPGVDDEVLSFGELLAALRNNVQASELVVEVEIDGETTRLERIPFPFLLEGRETLVITVQESEVDLEETEQPASEGGDAP